MDEMKDLSATQPAPEKVREKFFTPAKMAKAAMFTALAIILYVVPGLQVKLPFMFPSFLEIHFSDLPILIGGFLLGPVYGFIMIAIRAAVKLPMTSSTGVGELADLLISSALVITAALIYQKHKSKKGAVIGLIAGSLVSIAVALIVNRFILIPFYIKVYNMSGVVWACKALFPNITAQNFYSYYLPLTCLPFNALKSLIVCLITFFTYKHISRALFSIK